MSPDVAGAGPTEWRSCAILVLNYNGEEHLGILLPSLREAVARYPGRCTTVVVDNRSTKPDLEFVAREHPEVERVVAERNDYLFSLNPVVAGRREDVVIILNNDMRVDPGFIAPLLEHFEDPEVFAVSARVVDWDGQRSQVGQRTMELQKWWFYYTKYVDFESPRYTVEAGGGCAAFHRERFVQLGGFDRLLHPAYFEDLDLSYRAWMQGWSSIVEPRSLIYHRGGATLLDGGQKGPMMRRLSRNHVLFMLKNIGDWRFLVGFFAMLPYRFVWNLWKRNYDVAAGILLAIPRMPRALRARMNRTPTAVPPEEIAIRIRQAVPRDPLPVELT